MKKGLPNGLKCILRDIDFKKFAGEHHRTPSNKGGGCHPSQTLHPLTACAARFKPLA